MKSRKWIYFGISLVLVCMLVYLLEKKMEDARLTAAFEQTIQTLVTDAVQYETLPLPENSPLQSLLLVRRKSGEAVHIAVIVKKGYAGKVHIASAANSAGRLLGIAVGGAGFLETRGRGALAREATFQNQFVGLSAPLRLRSEGGKVDAISGATITTQAVLDGINASLAYLKTLQ